MYYTESFIHVHIPRVFCIYICRDLFACDLIGPPAELLVAEGIHTYIHTYMHTHTPDRASSRAVSCHSLPWHHREPVVGHLHMHDSTSHIVYVLSVVNHLHMHKVLVSGESFGLFNHAPFILKSVYMRIHVCTYSGTSWSRVLHK
jgi:hypothetical protein